MSIIVTSCGRSGTNMMLEILRASPSLKCSEVVEDKKFFKRGATYPRNYLTKCDILYANKCSLDNTMQLNPDLQIVWTLRDCRDMLLSKIRRGQPRKLGGDIKQLCDDATPEGSVASIENMFVYYKHVQEAWGDRLLTVKMEDTILHPVKTAKKMCRHLDIQYHQAMPNFTERMRNKSKRARYKTIDTGELAKWKEWQTAYDGFFSTHGYDMESLFKRVEIINRHLGYIR